jgi:hypothetical protein
MDSNLPKIDFTILGDGYVLTYNERRNKLIFVDPDDVLSNSVKDDKLPEDFLNKLDVDLDDRIDLDSGDF